MAAENEKFRKQKEHTCDEASVVDRFIEVAIADSETLEIAHSNQNKATKCSDTTIRITL